MTYEKEYISVINKSKYTKCMLQLPKQIKPADIKFLSLLLKRERGAEAEKCNYFIKLHFSALASFFITFY